MAKYRVVDGNHVQPDENGEDRIYKKGQICESEHDLEYLFPNSFVRVRESAPVADAPILKAAAADTETQARKDVKARRGRVQEENLELEDDSTYDAEASHPKSKKAEPVKSKLGQDVTGEFEVAKEENLLVFKKGKAFLVADKSKPDKAINPEPMTRKEVTAWIDAHVG